MRPRKSGVPKFQVYKCETCPTTTTRKETNRHWFLIRRANSSSEDFQITPWTDQLADDVKTMAWACGRDCAIKLLEQWMDSTTRPNPSAERKEKPK